MLKSISHPIRIIPADADLDMLGHNNLSKERPSMKKDFKALAAIRSLLCLTLLSCGSTEQGPTSTSITTTDLKYARAYEAYNFHCASCHNFVKPLTGPALSDELIDTRSTAWLYMFLTDSDERRKDPKVRKRQREYAPVTCITLDTVTTHQQEQIKLIIRYLKTDRHRTCQVF